MNIPDSGSRTSFKTGAVRDAATGKGLPSMIPPDFVRSVAKRFEDGAIKYSEDGGAPNWMKGIPMSRFVDAMYRHLLQFAEGDTSEDHIGAIGWNAAAAQWTEAAIARGELPAELMDLPFRTKPKKEIMQQTCGAHPQT